LEHEPVFYGHLNSFRNTLVNIILYCYILKFSEAGICFLLHRFRREEMKIQAWENHQKAKTEAKMKKIEVYTCYYY